MAAFIFWIGAAGISCNLLATTSMEWEDVAAIKESIEHARIKNYQTIHEQIAQKKDAAYTEFFLNGLIYEREKNQKEAVRWFARAAFLSREQLPAKYYPSVTLPYLNSLAGHSPLYEESILKIAEIYLKTHGPEYSLKALEYLPEKPGQISEVEALNLRVQIIAKINRAAAMEAYQSLNKIDPQPVYYLKLAGLAALDGDTYKAIENYCIVLQMTNDGWAHSVAADKLIETFENHTGLSPLDSQKILMAEGLRLKKKYPESLRLWKEIQPDKLEPRDLAYYLVHYARLLIDIRQPGKAESLIETHIDQLDNEWQEEVTGKIAPVFYDHAYYRELISLTSPDNGRGTLLHRIRALDKVEDPRRQTEAANYLRKHDPDSVYIETVFFKACFSYMQKKQMTLAENCLQDLRQATENHANGGRARFYLGRIYEERGQTDKAIEYYREVYLNSPAHYFAFTALTKAEALSAQFSPHLPQPAQPDQTETDDKPAPKEATLKQNMTFEQLRQWIATHYNPEDLDRFFQQRKEHPEFGIDPYWLDWENKMADMDKHGGNNEKKSAYFKLIDYNETAKRYPVANAEKKTLAYMVAAKKTQDTYLNYQAIRWYMALTEKQADIMTMPDSALRALFPVPYLKEVREAGDRYQIDEAHVYAFMKQESAFHPGATSRSGAMGLMQIMPATAKWLNKSMKISNLNLYNPAHSIQMAAGFYEMLYKMNDGTLEKIAIAYNAGPGRLSQWSKRYEKNDLEYFLEQIPVYETYAYVQKTRGYYDRYRILFDYYYRDDPL